MLELGKVGRFKRLRIIGDVHGEIDQFQRAVQGTASEGRYVIQLGDVVNHGPDSVGCLRIALSLIEEGTGVFLRGNHEAELMTYLREHSYVPQNHKFARTLRQIEAGPMNYKTTRAFVKMWDLLPWWIHLGQFLFVHGAFHPLMLDILHPGAAENNYFCQLTRSLALWGEGTYPTSEGLSQRTYGWIEQIPNGLTVVVGHDVRSKLAPFSVENTSGGKAIFIDTGCGKGGRLSWLDLELDI